MRIRSQPFPDAAALPYWLCDDDHALKAHPAYRQAKAGEQDAAIDLVWDLAIEFLSGLQAKLPLELNYVAPYAREATGDNAIPLMLGQCLRRDPPRRGGNRDCAGLPGVSHRRQGDGAPAAASPVRWAGGGQVAAVITLVNAGRLKALKPEALVIRRLRERFPDAIHHTFGIDPGALTANEASYLSGFRTADELRNRAAKAAEENDLRLRAKGFQLEAQPAPLSQENWP